jgi:putative peptidoglycan lipid II flippase
MPITKRNLISLTKTQNTILSAALVLSMASGVNAVLGFLKNRLLAYYFGVSNELAIFYTADKIPNLIYSIVIVGAVSTVFIPTFTNLLKKDEERAYKVASAIITSVMVLFVILGIVIYVEAPKIIYLLSLGKFSPQEIQLGTNLMRIMMVSQILLVGGSLVTSILQSYKYFLVPAMAPIFFNIGMLFGTIALSKSSGIFGPAHGVLLGALLHLGTQIPLLRRTRFKYTFTPNLSDKNFEKAAALVPPRLLQVALASGVQTIHNSLAILVSNSSVIFLKFATQLQFFPVSIFGLSMAAASLPTLSAQTTEDSLDKFKRSLYTSIHQMLYLVMPLSAILFVLRVPVVRIVYGVSNFPWEATIKTSYVLGFFSLSIFAQSTNYMLTRAFFALKNTKTPVYVSLITALINLGLSITFITVFKFEVWSIAAAYSLTSFLDTILLTTFLNKRLNDLLTVETITPFVKIAYSTILMAISLYAGLKILDIRILDTTRTLNLLILTAITSCAGIATYLIFTKMLKVEEIELFYKLIRKMKLDQILTGEKRPKVPQQETLN